MIARVHNREALPTNGSGGRLRDRDYQRGYTVQCDVVLIKKQGSTCACGVWTRSADPETLLR